MVHSPLLNVMIGAVLKAGKGLLRDFGEVDQLQISRKGTANFVTKSDVRTEKFLQKELLKARPDFGFLMEEGGEIAGKDQNHRWIIDPLDGTSNFIHAVPYFCTSVALERREGERSEIIAGVIYDPIHNDLFIAEKGKGAFLNDRRLMVSGRENMEEAMFVIGSLKSSPVPLDAIDGATLRYFGAAALDLAYIAAGRLDGGWHRNIQPWDIAAGMLMIREAGGVVTDFAGNTANCYTKTLLSSNRALAPQVKKLLSPAA